MSIITVFGLIAIGLCAGIVIGCNLMQILQRREFERRCRECMVDGASGVHYTPFSAVRAANESEVRK